MAEEVATTTAPVDSANYTVADAIERQTTDDQATDKQATDDQATDDLATDDLATDDLATDDQATDDLATDDLATDDEQLEKALRRFDFDALLAKPAVSEDPEITRALKMAQNLEPAAGYIATFNHPTKHIPAAGELIVNLARARGQDPEATLEAVVRSACVFGELSPKWLAPPGESAPAAAAVATPRSQEIDTVLDGLREADVDDSTVDALGALLKGQNAQIAALNAALTGLQSEGKKAAAANRAAAERAEFDSTIKRIHPGVAKAIADSADGFELTEAMLRDAVLKYPPNSHTPIRAVKARFSDEIAEHRVKHAQSAAARNGKAGAAPVATGGGGGTGGQAIDSRTYTVEDALAAARIRAEAQKV